MNILWRISLLTAINFVVFCLLQETNILFAVSTQYFVGNNNSSRNSDDDNNLVSFCSSSCSIEDLEATSKYESDFQKTLTDADREAAQRFVNKLSNIDTKNKNSAKLTNLLFEAISYKALEESVLEALIKDGANINILIGKISDPGAHTLIDRAVILNNYLGLRVLLKNGILVNRPTGFFAQTPLYRAVMKNDINMVSILLKHGALSEVMDKEGKTPIYYAQYNSEIENLLKKQKSQ